jgi:dTDP-glucose 4,6-dehydratase
MTLPPDDLEAIASQVFANGGDALHGRTIFMTGGTGFLGRWMVESFCALDDTYSLGARMFLLTRNPERFRFRHPSISLITGDVARLRDSAGLPSSCDYVICGATESARTLAREVPRLFYETVEGLRQTFEFAVAARAKRLLYFSSGAVYGRQTASHVSEDDPGAADVSDPQSTYAETKRIGELLCARYGLDSVIARGFSFVGPYIPLDRGFAAGNFIGNAIERTPIIVQGDGTAVRSYLYPADFAAWSWILLLRGVAGRAYNVGSEEAVTIRELATEAARLNEPPLPIEIQGKAAAGVASARYVPSTKRARAELGLKETIGWRDALRKTYDWYASQRVLETVS